MTSIWIQTNGHWEFCRGASQEGSASGGRCEAQPVGYAEGKWKFLPFLSWHSKSNPCCQGLRRVFQQQMRGNSWKEHVFHQFPLFLPQDRQLSGRLLTAELEAIKSRDIFALFRGQAFCQPGRSHNYLQASISESSVSDLPDRLKPQSAADEAGCPAPGSAEAINRKGWIHSCSHPHFSPW